MTSDSKSPRSAHVDEASPKRWSPWVRWTVPLLAAAVIGVLAGVAIASAIHMPQVQSLADFTPSLITEMQTRDGETFATFSLERRKLLREDEIPELLIQAVLASEDQGFYEHGGVDPLAIFRAQLANLRAGGIEEGASTLTMQLARELFLTRERKWRRKIEEALLAVELEKNFSKQQILTLYLNLINVGAGNYGMAAAAEDYFDKDVADLTLPEAATLVGILPAPSRYNPYRRPDLVLERRNTVLRRMVSAGYVTEEQATEAREQPLGLAEDEGRRRLGSYFAEDVRKHLDEAYGTTAVVEGGLQVETTLDAEIQRTAETALREGLVRLDHRKGWRGPLMQVEENDPETWTHPAWTGSDPVPGRWIQGVVTELNRNEARVRIEGYTYTLTPEGMEWTRRGRPDRVLERGDVAWFRLEAPEVTESSEASESSEAESETDEASTEPPAVDPEDLILYLEQEPEVEGAVVVLESATGAVRGLVGGWSFDRSKFNRASQALRQVGSAFKPFVYAAALEEGFTPADTLFDAPTAFPGADQKLSYMPRNYTRSFHGILTLRQALEKSINVPAVKLLDLLSVERVIEQARRMGIDAELPPYPSLALGSAEIIPLELASAYAAIANQGTWVEPYLIERVTTPSGEVVEEHLPNTRSAMDPRTAYVLVHMMEGTVDRGTATKIRDLPLDIAGKTGTTNDYTDAWFAGITPRYTILVWVGYDVKRSLGRGMTGAEAALPIWREVAEAGLEQGWLEEDSRFGVPAGVVTQTVEYNTGLLPGSAADRVVDEAFVEGTEPVQEFTDQWARVIGLPWYLQQSFYIPKEGERMPSDNPPDVADDGTDDDTAAR